MNNVVPYNIMRYISVACSHHMQLLARLFVDCFYCIMIPLHAGHYNVLVKAKVNKMKNGTIKKTNDQTNKKNNQQTKG